VANTFSDSISIVDVASAKIAGQIALGMQPPLSKAERGELLFYDARLSHDGWFSCHTCHPDGHTTSLLNDNQSDGSFGTPKRILTLRGVGDTGPWAWNGSMPDLERQVRTSIEKTMQGTKPTSEQVSDLTAFFANAAAAASRRPAGPGCRCRRRWLGVKRSSRSKPASNVMCRPCIRRPRRMMSA